MKTIKNNIKYLLVCLLLITACSREEGYEDITLVESPTLEMAGDWYVVVLWPDDLTPAFGGDYEIFSTTSTAADDGVTMIVDDHRNFFEIQTKIDVNLSDLTFTGKDNVELYYDGEVLLVNGNITKNSFTTTTGAVVDEIYFEAEFDWYPGTSFVFKGHKRTGFLEDESPHYQQ